MSYDVEGVAARFAVVARAYVDWIDGFSVASADDLRQLHQLIAQLQTVAADLLPLRFQLTPDEVDAESEVRRRALSDRARSEELEKRVSLLPIAAYRKVFHPLDLSEQPVIGTLQDDLVDIYSDLRVGLALFDSGDATEAAWSWQLSYRTHWGRHAVFAQTAIWDFQP